MFGIDFDAIKAIVLLDLNDDLLALSGGFVHPHDSVQTPIGDVDNVLEDDQRKRVTDKSGADGSDVRSVQFGMLDVIQQSVAPVEPVRLEIDGQAVGPAEENVLEDHQVSAIEVSPADVGRPVPLGVEDETLVGMDDNGSGALQVAE